MLHWYLLPLILVYITVSKDQSRKQAGFCVHKEKHQPAMSWSRSCAFLLPNSHAHMEQSQPGINRIKDMTRDLREALNKLLGVYRTHRNTWFKQ